MKKSKFIKNVLIGMLLFSITSLILFGIVGIGRKGTFSSDFQVMYEAGKDWLNGHNPYFLVPSEAPFAYPPNSAFFFVPLSLFNFNTARIVHLFLNLISLTAIIISTNYIFAQYQDSKENYSSLLMAAFIIGNPFTLHNIWMGQTSLISLAFLMMIWIFNYQNRLILVGICLGLSSFKPQLCFLVFLWFILERKYRVWAAFLGTTVFMSIYPMLTHGPINMMLLWYKGLIDYKTVGTNVAGFQHLVGVESLLHSAGINSPNLKILGVFLLIGLWLSREKFNYFDLLGIILGISLTFIYGHDYDYVCLVPLFISLLIYTHKNFKIWFWLIPLTFLLIFPQRLIRIFDISVLNHWRTIVVVLITGLVLMLNIKPQLSSRI
ncbi:MAG: glycosyltransferase family 87 protein [Crocosphaera sp.]|nr:glycosyltransferase family 87 protein [Crocosphaera sp.]